MAPLFKILVMLGWMVYSQIVWLTMFWASNEQFMSTPMRWQKCGLGVARRYGFANIVI